MANIIIYVILGWLIGEFFHMTLWEWTKQKLKLDNKKVKAILVFIGIALLIAMIGSGFYRVQSFENVVVTSLTGQKVIKDNIGIKYSLLSSREIVDLRKQSLLYPHDALFTDDEKIVTKDGKVTRVSAVLDYQIYDVDTWAIKNKVTEAKLYNYLSSTIISNIQELEYNQLMDNRTIAEDKIASNMKTVENLYGVKILQFYFVKTAEDVAVSNAKIEAEAQRITSKSLIESYESEAEALRTKYNSINDKEFIKYMEFIRAISEGDIDVVVLPQDSIAAINLNHESD